MENKLKFIVSDECNNMTALTFLKKQCNVSSRMITRLKREKNGILRNGKLLRTIDLLQGGDEVVLNLPVDKSQIVPVKGQLEILYEDEHILAVNKPYNMPVHPTKIHQLDTLANIVAGYSEEKSEHYTFRAINRLDKDTSGIVLIAKDSYSAAKLFKGIEKTYYAVCQGIINQKGTVNMPIKVKEGHTIERCVSSDGKPSVTHYKPLMWGNNHTLLELKLETGRTHQIRCHMSSISHPLAGDDMYGGSLEFIKRQALHCGKVEFNHPVTNKQIIIKSEIPEDFLNILKNRNTNSE